MNETQKVRKKKGNIDSDYCFNLLFDFFQKHSNQHGLKRLNHQLPPHIKCKLEM